MPDITLTCQNCHNQFVYSEIEQKIDAKNGIVNRLYCPICQSIIAQTSRRPAKPSKQK